MIDQREWRSGDVSDNDEWRLNSQEDWVFVGEGGFTGGGGG